MHHVEEDKTSKNSVNFVQNWLDQVLVKTPEKPCDWITDIFITSGVAGEIEAIGCHTCRTSSFWRQPLREREAYIDILKLN